MGIKSDKLKYRRKHKVNQPSLVYLSLLTSEEIKRKILSANVNFKRKWNYLQLISIMSRELIYWTPKPSRVDFPAIDSLNDHLWLDCWIVDNITERQLGNYQKYSIPSD